MKKDATEKVTQDKRGNYLKEDQQFKILADVNIYLSLFVICII